MNNNLIGSSLLGLLTITFIILKLCSVIKWNWFWVLSPTILPIIFGIILFILVFIYLIIKYTIILWYKRK